MKASCRLAICLCLVLGAVSPLRADTSENPVPKANPRMLAAFREVVAKPSQSTVHVLCQEKEVALGTIVRADGYIVTKFSELKTPIVCKLKSGKEYSAKLVGVETKNDLALLKVEAQGLAVIQWIESKSVTAGSWLASAGTERDPVAIGVVSVATRTLSPQDLAMSSRTPPPPNSGYLGIGIDAIPGGAKISHVEEKSPAARAGIKAGDVVLAVAGSKVPDPEQLVKLIQAFKPGDQVLMRIKRGEEELEVKAKLERRPDSFRRGFDRSEFQNSLGGQLSKRRGGFPTVLQHDTVLRPVDCGGPIVDLDGKAVGVNIARAGRVESYALPSELVQSLLPDMIAGKYTPSNEDEVAKALAWQKKLNAAEAEVKTAEDKLAEAKKGEDEDEIAAARKKLKSAQAAYEKLKVDREAAKK
jgi:serine protease Do